jgi:lactoylglutathione lyase
VSTVAGGSAVSSLSHAGVHAADLEQSLRFYRDLLGLEVINQLTTRTEHTREITGYPDAVLKVAILRIAGTSQYLEVMEYSNVPGVAVDPATGNVGTCHLAFFVDDLDTLFERLVQAGVRTVSRRVVEIPSNGLLTGAKVVYVMDPDGVRVELMQSRYDLDGSLRGGAGS